MYYVGLDGGSTYLKACLITSEKVLATKVLGSGLSNSENAEDLINDLCKEANINRNQIKGVYSTGYSRRSLEVADDNVSEITAHAFGVQFTAPKDVKPRVIIDIGGQDMKVISLTEDGKVNNFVMNDKCAAGTGKFIEVIAGILETTISEVGPISIKSTSPCDINSTCVVFAQTEIISLISQKKDRGDILSGLHFSMAKRIGKMARKYLNDGDILMTGGGAKNIGLVQSLEDELMTDIHVAQNSQFNGAIGAALYGQTLDRRG